MKVKTAMMKIALTILITILCYVISIDLYASQLSHTFKSPSFNGNGFSAHVLTIENQEFSRKKAITEKQEAEARQLARDAANTNLSKFLNNVESRIYAQLSKQLVDSMFGEDSASSGTVTFEGTTISYIKDDDNVTLTILDTDGSETVITVPIGNFTF